MSRSTFDTMFSTALDAYKKRTRNDLASHPLLSSLESCTSPSEILAALREQIPGFDQSHVGNDPDNLTNLLAPIANILFAFSVTLGEGIGLVDIMLTLS